MYRNRSWESRANRLSRILSAAGRRDEAIAILREALITVPDSSSIKGNLAALWADGGNREAAAALLRSAILKRPQDAKLRHGLSKVLKATDPQQAMTNPLPNWSPTTRRFRII